MTDNNCGYDVIVFEENGKARLEKYNSNMILDELNYLCSMKHEELLQTFWNEWMMGEDYEFKWLKGLNLKDIQDFLTKEFGYVFDENGLVVKEG